MVACACDLRVRVVSAELLVLDGLRGSKEPTLLFNRVNFVDFVRTHSWIAGFHWKRCQVIGGECTRFGSMISGESVLFGVMAIATRSKSSIIIRKGAVKLSKLEAFVPPVHPGEILRENFMKPLALTVSRLARELNVPATRIGEIARERRRVTAETALRLARSFNTNA